MFITSFYNGIKFLQYFTKLYYQLFIFYIVNNRLIIFINEDNNLIDLSKFGQKFIKLDIILRLFKGDSVKLRYVELI